MRKIGLYFAAAVSAAALGVAAAQAVPLTKSTGPSASAGGIDLSSQRDPRDGGQVKRGKATKKKAAKRTKKRSARRASPARPGQPGARDPRDSGQPAPMR